MTTATSASCPTSEGPTTEPGMDLELEDDLHDFHFVWPTVEDRSVAAKEGQIQCLAYEQAAERRFVRNRRVVVAHPDTDQGERVARGVAKTALRKGARSARLWAVPGFGTGFQTMREWVQQHSLVNTFALERAGQWKGFVSVVSIPTPEAQESRDDPPLPLPDARTRRRRRRCEACSPSKPCRVCQELATNGWFASDHCRGPRRLP